MQDSLSLEYRVSKLEKQVHTENYLLVDKCLDIIDDIKTLLN